GRATCRRAGRGHGAALIMAALQLPDHALRGRARHAVSPTGAARDGLLGPATKASLAGGRHDAATGGARTVAVRAGSGSGGGEDTHPAVGGEAAARGANVGAGCRRYIRIVAAGRD